MHDVDRGILGILIDNWRDPAEGGEFGTVTGLSLRRMEIEALGLEAEASRLLRHHRVIGFNTYGEQHHGMHINQTFTGVVIGQRRLAADGTGGQDGA